MSSGGWEGERGAERGAAASSAILPPCPTAMHLPLPLSWRQIYFELNQFMLNLVCTAPSGGDSAQAAGGDGGDT